jgi:hypothetical protein
MAGFRRLLALLSLISAGFLISSCTRDDSPSRFRENVSFEISNRFLEGKRIDCISFGTDNKVWIASGNQLFLLNNSETQTWTLDYRINDLAESPDGSLWIGSKNGLGHFDGTDFEWYNSSNAGLPTNFVSKVKVSKDRIVWFSASAFRIGGLGIYDGKRFEFLTPDNSPLNQNIIDDLEIGDDGSVYLVTAGTVGRTNIYKIKDRNWACLGNQDGTFYWTFSFAVSQLNEIYLVEDFSLSSSSLSKNKLYKFTDSKWKEMQVDFDISYFSRMTIDQRNYFWLVSNGANSPRLNVYDGSSWINSSLELLSDDGITVIKSDNKNRIWIGTYNNGVIVINQ